MLDVELIAFLVAVAFQQVEALFLPLGLSAAVVFAAAPVDFSIVEF